MWPVPILFTLMSIVAAERTALRGDDRESMPLRAGLQGSADIRHGVLFTVRGWYEWDPAGDLGIAAGSDDRRNVLGSPTTHDEVARP